MTALAEHMIQTLGCSPADSRIGVRSNVFLNASMVAGGHTTNVRVRNISERGALIDGTRLPAEGSPVQLRRGSLSAAGEVAWQTGGQAGIRFDGPVYVPAWVRRVGQIGQDRVDRLVQVARGNDIPALAGPLDKRAEDGVEQIRDDLIETCERLADLAFSIEQSEEYLKLDAIAQRLTKLIKTHSQFRRT
jgi:hypothetical protein